MTKADGPGHGGDSGWTGAEEAAVPGDGSSDDRMVDEEPVIDSDEVLDAELVDDRVVEGVGIIEGEAAEFDPMDAALAQRDEYLDSLKRLQAEFENYKKRVLKQQVDQVARAAASLVEKLLPVLDALDLATDHVGDDGSAEAKALVAASGLLQGILAKEGLERIDPAGEEFDPNAHEAVGQVPPPDDAEPTESGEPVVSQVMRAGYRWHGTVVRPAMVLVQG